MIAWGPALQQGGLLAVVVIVIAVAVSGWRALHSKRIVMGWQYDEKVQECIWWRGLAIELLNVNTASVQSTRILAQKHIADGGTTGPEAVRNVR